MKVASRSCGRYLLMWSCSRRSPSGVRHSICVFCELRCKLQACCIIAKMPVVCRSV